MRRLGVLLPQTPAMEALAQRLASVAEVVAVVHEPVREASRFIRTHALEGVVVGAVPTEEARLSIMAALRGVKVDPFAFELVALEELALRVHPHEEALIKASRLLRAALARLRAYEGTRQENLRPSLIPKKPLSRRAFFALASLRYEVIPAINDDRCVASRGCRLCVTVCPHNALALEGGLAHINKALCQGCGLCLPACPTRAIDHPLFSPRSLDVTLKVLLEDVASRSIIAFTCSEAMALLRQAGREGLAYPASVLPLEVPCLGALDWFSVLRALDLGAAGVAFLPCGTGCPHHSRAADLAAGLRVVLGAWGLAERLFLLQAVELRELAEELRSVAAAIAASPPSPLAQGKPTDPPHYGYQAASLAAALHERLSGDPDLALTHPELPFGTLELDHRACSLCGMCAQGCPTGALAYREKNGQASLSFQASLCALCGLCVEACPEKALGLKRSFAPRLLSGPPQILQESLLARCCRCGGEILPQKLMDDVLGRLPVALAYLKDYCPHCRPFAIHHR